MPVSRRKFIAWTYTDEGTNKEYPIQVYTVVEADGTVLFEAEVTLPVRFIDRDENANVLKKRVLARCASDRKLVWKPYFLITVSGEDPDRDPLVFNPASRNYWGAGILFETFESAVMPDGMRIWRGIGGKSHRFTPQAKPGWPPTGRTDRGGMCSYFADTPENQDLLRQFKMLFLDVVQGLRAAFDPTKATAMRAVFDDIPSDELTNIWRRLRAMTKTTKEATCPEDV